MHGTLDSKRRDWLRGLRSKVDLYFDSGDAVKAGNLGMPMRPEPVWGFLGELDCTASVLGNREAHILEAGFRAKTAGAGHPLLCANMRRRDGDLVLPGSLELTVHGVRVGVVAVMVPMVTERMRTQSASAFLWDPPIAAAVERASELRARVDLLVGLTHIGHRQDLELAHASPHFDLILGGHSHTVLSVPVRVGQTLIGQGGSHCRFAGLYDWDSERGWSGTLLPIP